MNILTEEQAQDLVSLLVKLGTESISLPYGGGETVYVINRIRDTVRGIIVGWLSSHRKYANINPRVEFHVAYPWSFDVSRTFTINLGYASLFSSVGGIDNKSRWLNKITFDYSRLDKPPISHVARTDSRFLGPDLVEEFRDFLIHLKSDLDAVCNEADYEFAGL